MSAYLRHEFGDAGLEGLVLFLQGPDHGIRRNAWIACWSLCLHRLLCRTCALPLEHLHQFDLFTVHCHGQFGHLRGVSTRALCYAHKCLLHEGQGCCGEPSAGEIVMHDAIQMLCLSVGKPQFFETRWCILICTDKG